MDNTAMLAFRAYCRRLQLLQCPPPICSLPVQVPHAPKSRTTGVQSGCRRRASGTYGGQAPVCERVWVLAHQARSGLGLSAPPIATTDLTCTHDLLYPGPLMRPTVASRPLRSCSAHPNNQTNSTLPNNLCCTKQALLYQTSSAVPNKLCCTWRWLKDAWLSWCRCICT